MPATRRSVQLVYQPHYRFGWPYELAIQVEIDGGVGAKAITFGAETRGW